MDARQKVVLAALQDFGIPYRWGGNHPDDLGVNHLGVKWPGVLDIKTGERVDAHGIRGGMDCSGAVLYWWRKAGIHYHDETAAGLFANLDIATQPKPGDLCFYGKTGTGPTHVVMALTVGAWVVIGANGGRKPGARETLSDYARAMQAVRAGVRVETGIDGKGYAYRSDFRGFRRMPLHG